MSQRGKVVLGNVPASSARRCFSPRFQKPISRCSSPAAPAMGDTAARKASLHDNVQKRISRLWSERQVPLWHRELYAARFFDDVARLHILKREAKALEEGTAIVQVAANAIEKRNQAVASLRGFREKVSDDDLVKKASLKKEFRNLLINFRIATVSVVEAIVEWKRSVAPAANPSSSAGTGRPTTPMGVASPSTRGAYWPFGPNGEDCLWIIYNEDWFVRDFQDVLVLEPLWKGKDPLLLRTASATTWTRKVHPPAVDGLKKARIEAATFHLLEDQVSRSLFSTLSPKEAMAANSDRCLEDVGSASPALDSLRSRTSIIQMLPFLPGRPDRHEDLHDRTFTPQNTHRKLKRGSADAGLLKRRNSKTPTSGTLLSQLHSLTPASGGIVWNIKGDIAEPTSVRQTQPKSLANSIKQSVAARSTFSDSSNSFEESLPEAAVDLTFSASPVHAGPTVDLVRTNATFRRYNMDGVVHQDDVTDCLRRLGFCNPEPAWVDEAFGSVTRYTTLDPAEFILFVAAYEDKLRIHCREEANRHMTDKGEIDKTALTILMRDLRLDPLDHVVEEIFADVDKNGDGHIDFEEFFGVVRCLQEREGFTKAEHEQFFESFKLFDRDHSGEMDEQELLQVLLYLGYEVARDDVQSVMQDIDFDGTGTMDQHEFVVCMRRFRQREMQLLKAAFVQNDVDLSGTVEAEELINVLAYVGYLPEEEVILEILADLGLDGNEISLSWDLLAQFMVLLRSREGLSKRDTRAVEEAFERYASGIEVSTIFIPKILRYMGYSLTYEERQALVMQVDVDCSGAIGLYELRKLFRICMEQRSRTIEAVFKQFVDMRTPIVTTRSLPEALRNVGCIVEGIMPTLSQDIADQISEIGGLDLRGFLKLSRQLFRKLEEDYKNNGGFSKESIPFMRAAFRRRDINGDGTIQNSELVELVKAVFPGIASDPKLRPQLKDIIRETDDDGNGGLDFEDFARLMRTVCDMRHKNQLLKERQAVADTGFEPDEVYDFRALFRNWANKGAYLDLQTFQDMILPFCPLGDRNRTVLEGFWQDALKQYSHMGEVRDLLREQVDESTARASVDLAEFLWLMSRILDTNFANVNDRLRREHQDASKTSDPAGIARVKVC